LPTLLFPSSGKKPVQFVQPVAVTLAVSCTPTCRSIPPLKLPVGKKLEHFCQLQFQMKGIKHKFGTGKMKALKPIHLNLHHHMTFFHVAHHAHARVVR